MTTTAEILRTAKERLRGHWCRGAYFRAADTGKRTAQPVPDCQCCAVGAARLALVQHGRTDQNWWCKDEVFSVLSEAAQCLGKQRGILRRSEYVGYSELSSVVDYNDRYCNTEEEVLQLFDTAIELAQAQEAPDATEEPESVQA